MFWNVFGPAGKKGKSEKQKAEEVTMEETGYLPGQLTHEMVMKVGFWNM